MHRKYPARRLGQMVSSLWLECDGELWSRGGQCGWRSRVEVVEGFEDKGKDFGFALAVRNHQAF